MTKENRLCDDCAIVNNDPDFDNPDDQIAIMVGGETLVVCNDCWPMLTEDITQ